MTRQQTRWANRKGYRHPFTTKLQDKVTEVLKRSGREGLRAALGNYSRNPKGNKRTSAPRDQIWPDGRTAKPGRMV